MMISPLKALLIFTTPFWFNSSSCAVLSRRFGRRTGKVFWRVNRCCRFFPLFFLLFFSSSIEWTWAGCSWRWCSTNFEKLSNFNPQKVHNCSTLFLCACWEWLKGKNKNTMYEYIGENDYTTSQVHSREETWQDSVDSSDVQVRRTYHHCLDHHQCLCHHIYLPCL